jgi:hypothetical protein
MPQLQILKITDTLPVFGLLDCLAGIVISVKILGLKFLPYIAEITGSPTMFFSIIFRPQLSEF